MPTTTATSYSRRTITGGRKTVQYYTNGRKSSLSTGRGLYATKTIAGAATYQLASRPTSRYIGSKRGNVTRRVTIDKATGGQRLISYSVSRDTNARTNKKSRQAMIRKAGGRNVGLSAVRNAVSFGQGYTSGTVSAKGKGSKSGMRHSGGNRQPPQMSSAQRRAIARRRRRGPGGKFA